MSNLLKEYSLEYHKIPLQIEITEDEKDFVLRYDLSISSISKTTQLILERIREELVKEVNLTVEDLENNEDNFVENEFKKKITYLIEKFFSDTPDEIKNYLKTYLYIRSLGIGYIEFLIADELLEEITVNSSKEPIWVYHREFGWLKTNITLKDEDEIKHYSMIIARRVNKQISILTPLLDAHLETGERVNATIQPISHFGNTITIRKFSKDPWTITKLLSKRTLSYEAAAFIWICFQYELSAMISGGTAAGKTSTMNSFANFFPPNQRIISIEDTKELQLPKFLHWVSMLTREPNNEGIGRIEMQDLLVNSLRMRPDRIIVGEVRRKKEAETLLEAIHTGHSCYATFHANNTKETINRLTNIPIEIPKSMLPAISLIITQFRNRRTGMRRTYEIGEILADGTENVIFKYDAKKDSLIKVNSSKKIIPDLLEFTGFSIKELEDDLKFKENVLRTLVKKEVFDVDSVGRIIAQVYTKKEKFTEFDSK